MSSLLSSYCRCFIFHNFRIFHIDGILTKMSNVAFCFSPKWSLFDTIKPTSRAWTFFCPPKKKSKLTCRQLSSFISPTNTSHQILNPCLFLFIWSHFWISCGPQVVDRSNLLIKKVKWHCLHSCDIIDFRSLNIGELTNTDFSFQVLKESYRKSNMSFSKWYHGNFWHKKSR